MLRLLRSKVIVKKEKEMHASFAVLPQTAKVIVTMHDKCLIKMEKIFWERETTFTQLLLQYIIIIVLFYYCC